MLCDLPIIPYCGVQWQHFQPILPEGKTHVQWGTVSVLVQWIIFREHWACFVPLLCSLQQWLVDLCSSCNDPILSVVWVPDIAFTSATAKLQLTNPPSKTPRCVCMGKMHRSNQTLNWPSFIPVQLFASAQARCWWNYSAADWGKNNHFSSWKTEIVAYFKTSGRQHYWILIVSCTSKMATCFCRLWFTWCSWPVRLQRGSNGRCYSGLLTLFSPIPWHHQVETTWRLVASCWNHQMLTSKSKTIKPKDLLATPFLSLSCFTRKVNVLLEWDKVSVNFVRYASEVTTTEDIAAVAPKSQNFVLGSHFGHGFQQRFTNVLTSISSTQ